MSGEYNIGRQIKNAVTFNHDACDYIKAFTRTLSRSFEFIWAICIHFDRADFGGILENPASSEITADNRY